MDIIDAGPHLPLTTSTLARQCHVSVRTLQEGFQHHLGISPMTYLRQVRLRRAHRDLRPADPSHSTVASIAHGWGVHPPRQLLRRPQEDVRRNTAASPARCALMRASPADPDNLCTQRAGRRAQSTLWRRKPGGAQASPPD